MGSGHILHLHLTLIQLVGKYLQAPRGDLPNDGHRANRVLSCYLVSTLKLLGVISLGMGTGHILAPTSSIDPVSW